MAKKCFLICPIGSEDSDIRKRSDKVMKYLLSPVCSQKGYEVIRSDLIVSVNRISSDIINHLENDDLAIADLTGCNPNVFYEIGYRKAKGMPTIHIAEKGTDLPFDTIDDRAIFFDITDIESAEKFKELLSKTIDNIPPINKTPKSYILGGRIIEEKKEEKPYISLLREIVNKFNSNGRRSITYSPDNIDKNDVEILSSKGYVNVTKYRDGSVSIKPTGVGLEYILYNP